MIHFGVMLATAGICLADAVAPARTYRNPIIDTIGPADPAVIRYEDTYYLYPTLDGRGYDVFVSDDLVHWEEQGKCFTDARGGAWAPDVFHFERGDNRFYLYYTLDRPGGGKLIGVAVADGPLGPFEDRGTLVEGAIDAHLFQNDDGALYLYYADLDGFRITVQPMADPLTAKGEQTVLIQPTERWEMTRGRVTEGPWMLKRAGVYYLMYSGSGADGPDYAIGYATAASPVGPFSKHPGNPITGRGNGVFGPGHHCVTTGPHGGLWMIYHQQNSERIGWDRFLAIDPLWFDDEGVIHVKTTRGIDQPSPSSGRHPQPDTGVTRIEWDHATRTLVARNAGYARMTRTLDGDILCVFDRGGRISLCRSEDDGHTWLEAVHVAGFEFGHATNPELLELRNGWILCAYNERPTDRVHPYAIVTTLSKDAGRTWSPGDRVYEAGVRFRNGCWEPAAIQLPTSEIQLFFANEGPYRASDEQEITMLRSKNHGRTWSDPTTISFRGDHRDGMPVPLVLKDRRGLVVAIEDSGLHGALKPVIIFSSLKDNWRRGFADGRSPRRWRALETPLPAEVNGSAPYIRQMPTGETILSVQSNEGGRNQPHMVVFVGDETARNFASPSVPFHVGSNTGCWWNSLFVKDKNTVTAVAGTRIDGISGVWAVDGRLVRSTRRMTGPHRPPPKVDEPRVVAVWNHSVANGPPARITLYSTGSINDPTGSATWSLNGRWLVLRWPNDQAPGGAWVDRCLLSSNGRTYQGNNQVGTRISGTLVTR